MSPDPPKLPKEVNNSNLTTPTFWHSIRLPVVPAPMNSSSPDDIDTPPPASRSDFISILGEPVSEFNPSGKKIKKKGRPPASTLKEGVPPSFPNSSGSGSQPLFEDQPPQ